MKNKYLFLFLIFLILNVLLCIQLWKSKNQTNIQTNENGSVTELKNIIAAIIVNSSLQINPFELVRVEEDTSTIFLNSLITGPKLFFYYNELSCSPCSEREIHKLDSISKLIGAKNIFLLTKSTSTRNVYLLKRANKFDFKIIFIDNRLNLPIFDYPTNFYFIMDNDLQAKLFFVPSKTFADVSEIYYSRIIQYFKSSFQI